MNSNSLQDKRYTGGLYGARGHDFEISYILSQLPHWLLMDELKYFQQELWSDLELFFESGSRWLIQIKNHQLELVEFREVLSEFQKRQADCADRYEKFLVISTGEVSSVREVRNFLDRWRDINHLNESELTSTKEKFKAKLKEHGLEEVEGFLIDNPEKIQIETECGWVKNEGLVSDFFISNLTVTHKISYEAAEVVFLRMAKLLTAERGKAIDLLPFRNELLTSQRSGDPSSVNTAYRTLNINELQPPSPQAFVGRLGELEQLNSALEKFNTLVIGGISGIGKTYLATKFAQSQKDKYFILWLDCEPFTDIEQFLAQLANTFRDYLGASDLHEVLQQSDANEVQRIKIAISILNEKSCLLVWDNFNPSIHRSLLPFLELSNRRLTQGKLLITSREWADLNDLFNPIHRLSLSRLDEEAGLKMLRDLGLADQDLDTLTQGYKRVNGHPKFLALLAGLSKSFSFRELLNELPFVTEKVHAELKEKVFDTLDFDAKTLLTKLSVLTSPFRISIIKYLMPVPKGYAVFNVLTSRFLITLQNQSGLYYEIHDLVRELSSSQVSDKELPAIHRELYSYYSELQPCRFLDAQATIYHALNAGLTEEAAQEARELLYETFFRGYYDMMLKYASWLLSDEQAQMWGFVHHMVGRSLRVKEQYTEAIAAYEEALKFALNNEDAEVAKFELASTLISLPAEDDSSRQDMAKQYYSQLSQSSNPTTKLQALYSLCFLRMVEGDDQSIIEMKELLSLAEKSNLDVNNYQVCYGLGRAYALIRKDYRQAIQYLERSRAIQQGIQGEEGLLALPRYFTNYALAEAYGNVRRITDAVNFWRLCVDIDRSLELEKRLAKSLHLLGRELCKQGSYSEAKERLAESVVLIEKHNIQNGAKRSHFQWIAVALWNLGEYENAVECCMRYIHQCELDGVEHSPMPVVMAADLRADADLIKSREEGAILFVLPQPYELSHYYNWVKIIALRFLDLAYLANRLMFTGRADSGLSGSDTRPLLERSISRIGRNEKCPCGSGKKYKKCCMSR